MNRRSFLKLAPVALVAGCFGHAVPAKEQKLSITIPESTGGIVTIEELDNVLRELGKAHRSKGYRIAP